MNKEIKSTPTALELEGYLIPRDRWHQAPKPAYDLAEAETREGAPTGIALYKEDYYIIQTNGQGPYIIWP